MRVISETHQEYHVPVKNLCNALEIPRASYYRKDAKKTHPVNAKQKTAPTNAVPPKRKQAVMDLLHSEEFIDKTPYDLYYALLDKKQYFCSPRTIYRLLEKSGENADRRNQRNHRDAVKPELVAISPNTVWSWDITKLLSTQRLTYFYLYVILDIYSRYIVGWMLADRECKQLARRLIHASALKHNIEPGQLVLHSDNGPSMTSKTVSQLLDHLQISKSHNRPYTSNDNPFSESQFKPLKYRPDFPTRFNSSSEAELFCQKFFKWYNQEHYHSGILWLTPESVHYGYAESILKNRHETLLNAYRANPVQFNNKPPKIKKLPGAVYINPPQTVSINALQEEISVAK